MVLKWNDIQKLGGDKFDEAEALEIKANKMLEDAQIAFEKAQQTLYDAKVEAKQLQKQASALYRESDQLYAQAEAMERDERLLGRSFNQHALQQTESRLLGISMVRYDPTSVGNAGGRSGGSISDPKIRQLLAKLKKLEDWWSDGEVEEEPESPENLARNEKVLDEMDDIIEKLADLGYDYESPYV